MAKRNRGSSPNVSQPDRLWSEIQDRQLNELRDINESISDSLSIDKDIFDSLDVRIPDVLNLSTDRLLSSLGYLTGISIQMRDISHQILNSLAGTTVEISRLHQDAVDVGSSLNELSESIEGSINDTTDAVDNIVEEVTDSLEDLSESVDNASSDITKSLEDLKSDLLDSLENAGKYSVDSANKFSEMYNDTIRFLGADNNSAQNFRENVLGQVDKLNQDIDGIAKLSPSKALDTMLSIANNANIANQQSLQNLVNPLLLAQETTNLSLESLATLGDRFYHRYNFNSKHMEGLVNGIRNLSENNNVDQSVLLEAVTTMETRYGRVFKDADNIAQATKGLTTGVAYLENNKVDPKMFIEDLHKFLDSARDPEIVKELRARYGDQYESIKALAHDSTKQDYAIQRMITTLASQDDTRLKRIAGVDDDNLRDSLKIFAEQLKEGSIQSLEDFKNSIDDSVTARDRLGDKFVSVQDQILNKMDNITQHLATIQENLGVGLDDIALLLSVSGNVFNALGGRASLTKGGIAGLLGLGGKGGILGMLSSAGPAIGIGAAIVAIGAVVNSIFNTIDRMNQREEDNYKSTISNVGGLGADDDVIATIETIVNPDGSVDKNIVMRKAKEGETQTEEDALKLLEEVKNFKQDRILGHHSSSTGFLADTISGIVSGKGPIDAYSDALGNAKNSFIDDDGSFSFSGATKSVLGMGSGDNWYDYIPFTGGLVESVENLARVSNENDISSFNKRWYQFLKSLNAEDRKLYSAYLNKGLLVEGDQEQMKFFIDHFDEFKKLSANGYASSQVSTKGLLNPLPRADVLGYDQGTNFIPEDQLAYLHKGEAVTPARYNPANNMNELERLRKDNDEGSGAELVSLLSEIKEFMQHWKHDNDMKRSVEKNKLNSLAMKSLSRFQTIPN